MVLGRPGARDQRYLPPGAPYNQGADVYSVGAILFRALTGVVPDPGSRLSPDALNPEAPAALCEAALKAMSSSDNRVDAQSVSNMLQLYLTSVSLPSSQPPKQLVYIPALILLGLIAFLQRGRAARQEVLV